MPGYDENPKEAEGKSLIRTIILDKSAVRGIFWIR